MKNKKPVVGILAGGQSAEHEVSLQSAKNVLDALDKARYEPVFIGIQKTGRWSMQQRGLAQFLHEDDPSRIALAPGGAPVTLAPGRGGRLFNLETGREEASLDVVFPILHGPFGEDGTVQGLLKLAGVPFVGAGVLGSAVGMDKAIAKQLLRAAGVPVAGWVELRADPSYKSAVEQARAVYKIYEEVFGLPFFVKPANMGSSVGVSKVHSKTEFVTALKQAFAFDQKVIIEDYIEGREIECAVLEWNNKVLASPPGEIRSRHEFYSYEAKYLDEKGAELLIPAALDQDTVRTVKSLARKTFSVLCCEGLARVDFFVRPDGGVLVNEINTMPGFTRISMYPKLWERSGVPYPRLISRLISRALERGDILS
ncbi:MAG: D-alanine--D-alanine ligase [Treponema sp.]|nr:D-alanine--D-alanine ligase [Treponema sp.]